MISLFLLAHLVADFALQPYWLVILKRRWIGLLIHGSIVLGCMLALQFLEPSVWSLWPQMIIITLVHVSTDYWKVHFGDHLLRPPVVPFMLDQLIHGVTIVIMLLLALPGQHVWNLSESPAMHAAIYASGYVLTTLATPIAVMIWLDPTFQYAALARNARFRSLCIGACVVSLMLVGAFPELLVLLVGILGMFRYPFSQHPLDAPIGVGVVLCTAAIAGTVLLISM